MNTPTNVSLLSAGTLINNRYLVERLIGQGGMGAVYEALDQRLGGPVALKQTTLSGEQSDRAFEREARLLARLRHPALPKVIDYFTDEVGQFLVMEFFPGEDLAHQLTQRGGSFSVDQVLDWAEQLLQALVYLHNQEPPVLHRDIKPQNIKLTASGDIVLLDFGLAKSQAAMTSRTTTSGSIVGYTPMYAPLEQIQSTGTDARSDLYALGATLYHLLAGVPPRDTLTRAAASVSKQPDPLRPLSEINPQVPGPVSGLIGQAMALDPAERFATAGAMRVALNRARQGQPPQAASSGSQPWDQETHYAAATRPDTRMFGIPGSQPAQQHPAEAPAPQTIPVSHQPPEARAATDHQATGHGRERPRWKYLSPFWPILLIGMGVLWLLASVGVLTPFYPGLVFELWPVLLIMLGFELLLGKRYPRLNAVVGAGLALLVLGFVALVPLAGFGQVAMRNEQIQTPVGNAEWAEVEIDLASRTIVQAIAEPETGNLLEGNLFVRGALDFDGGDEDDSERSVSLSVDSPFFVHTGGDSSNEVQPCTIWLTPDVPLALSVEGGLERTTLDLSNLDLVDLDVEGGAGPWNISLPDTQYIALFEGGAGSFDIDLAEGSDAELELDIGAGSFDVAIGNESNVVMYIDGGAGSITIDVPDDAGVELRYDKGFGSINVPDGYDQRGDDDDGVLTSPNVDQAEDLIVLEFDGGAGSLTIE